VPGKLTPVQLADEVLARDGHRDLGLMEWTIRPSAF
jgi:hypothetical protein